MKTSYIIIIVGIVVVIAIFMLTSKSKSTVAVSSNQQPYQPQVNPVQAIQNSVSAGASLISTIGGLFKRTPAPVVNDSTVYDQAQGWYE